MKSFWNDFVENSKIIFIDRRYLAFFIILIGTLLGLMIAIQVITVPGNNVGLQVQIFSYKNYLFFGLLAILSSFLIVLQVYIIRGSKSQVSQIVGNSSLGGIGVFSALFSSVLGTATCGICLTALFGFLGFGTVLFLVQNKLYLILASVILLLLSLYFSYKKLNSCNICSVKNLDK